MKTKLLLIEDDPHIVIGLEELLKTEGFEVRSCARGDKGEAALAEFQPDLLILDVMLPGLSGYDLCKKIRERNIPLPILMLTAKGQEIDKVVGLELGADDYVTKPFGVRELLARIHALLRRTGKSDSEGGAGESFRVGDAMIHPKKFQVCRGKVTEDLTARELKLLQLFYHHPGEVFSRDKLLSEVWGYNYFGTTRTLDQTIVQLRKKIGDNGGSPRYLLTVHGVGYKLAG